MADHWIGTEMEMVDSGDATVRDPPLSSLKVTTCRKAQRCHTIATFQIYL